MAFTTEDNINRIKKFIFFIKENKDDLAAHEFLEILNEIEKDRDNYVQKSEFREFLIEIREGLKRMEERFVAIDKRFEDLIHYVDKRFEELVHYVDKRFEELIHLMDKRFEDMNKRFEAQDKRFEDMNKRFEAQDKRFEDMNKRFEDMNKRFEELIHLMDKRFEAQDKRFEAQDKRFEDMNKRLEELIHLIDKRFEAQDKQLVLIKDKISYFQWFLGFITTLIFGLIAYFSYKQTDIIIKKLDSTIPIQQEKK